MQTGRTEENKENVINPTASEKRKKERQKKIALNRKQPKMAEITPNVLVITINRLNFLVKRQRDGAPG